MTHWQRHMENLRAIIERDYVSSQMNTTKWMEMLDALGGLELWWRIKLITLPEPSYWRSQIEGGNHTYLPRGYIEGSYSPVWVLEIEWIEVQPRSAAGSPESEALLAETERRLAEIQVPYQRDGCILRVTGHVRR